jgi:hypothetical protein
MKKPAIFIDAFITTPERHDILSHNINQFSKYGWDVFVISNHMLNFSAFHNVKYFEYDSRNRLLTDRNRYELPSMIYFYSDLYNEIGDAYRLTMYQPTHGFTNWTLLYNIRRMALAAKRYGHTHFIGCEYDILFKNYNLLETIFKDYGSTSANNIVIRHNGWGCTTNLYLLDVDVVLNTLPEMETVEQHDEFLIQRYGSLRSPVFEQLFSELFSSTSHVLPSDVIAEHTENWGVFGSEGDRGYRHGTHYKNLVMTPVNNNTSFFLQNLNHKSPLFIEYKTNTTERILVLSPSQWTTIPCEQDQYVDIRSSETIQQKSTPIHFDLTTPSNATITPL